MFALAREWSEQQTGRAISLAYASSERMCVCAKLCMHLTSIVQAFVCVTHILVQRQYIVYTCQGLLAHFQHRHMPPVWCRIVFVVHSRTDRLNARITMLLFAKAAKANQLPSVVCDRQSRASPKNTTQYVGVVEVVRIPDV